MSATPRWRYIVDPDGKYGIYPEGGKFVAIADGEEAARRIVRAVNAHDALVGALRNALSTLESCEPPECPNEGDLAFWCEHRTRTITSAHAALKLAEPQR